MESEAAGVLAPVPVAQLPDRFLPALSPCDDAARVLGRRSGKRIVEVPVTADADVLTVK